MSSSHAIDVYGGNYPKAKRLAIARSGGKCQFCGLRKAEEGHHWAWPDYPSGEEVQGHDITALCKVCHELATMLRDWVGRKDANIDQLAKEIKASGNFYEKRKAFSRWLFPPKENKTASLFTPSRNFDVQVPARVSTPAYTAPKYPEKKKTRTQRTTNTTGAKTRTFRTESRSKIGNELYGYEVELQILRDIRDDIQRKMNAPVRPSNWYQLEEEYASAGRQMGAVIRKKKRMQAEQKKMSLGEMTFLIFWVAPISLAVLIIFLLVTFSG